MTTTAPLVGAELNRTETRTLYWDVESGTALDGTVSVAVLGLADWPDTASVFTTASWASAETTTGEGTPAERHFRTCSLLVSGPDGVMAGAPKVVQPGEWSTWVRVESTSERDEIPGQILVVRA